MWMVQESRSAYELPTLPYESGNELGVDDGDGRPEGYTCARAPVAEASSSSNSLIPPRASANARFVLRHRGYRRA